MDVALSPLRQMGIHILNYLDDWLILAQSEAVSTSHRTLLLSHLECLGLRVNFAKSILIPSQQVLFLGTVIDSMQMTATVSAERATTIQRHAASFKEGTTRPLKAFQRMLGLMAAASPVLGLGLLHMRPIQFWLKQRVPHAAWRYGRHRITVTRACVSALSRWRDPSWLKRGVVLDMVHRRKVVTTDASNKGWGALCEGRPAFGLWSKEETGLHINCLEMLAVCRACLFFLRDIEGHHVLIRSDSRSVVSYINHQGGLVSKRLCALAKDLLNWAQVNLRSLKATHVPGKMNLGADMLSRNNVSSEEWTLHPLTVQKIWDIFGRARVDLFASEDNSHCPIYFTRSTDALAHEWPSLPLYAFPPIALLPQVLRRVREQQHRLLLIAPFWRNQPWVSELFQLLEAAPWPIPLRRDLLSQANGTLWHPRPELWALHVWPLNGSLLSSQSES
jgi:ribonuclease HI